LLLRAAINYWHREYGPLSAVPALVIPRPPEPREDWLTRSEAARLLWAARRIEHLKRFILLALWTGPRSSAILTLTWDRLDLERGIMQRRGYGEIESETKRTPPVRLSQRAVRFLRRWRKLDAGQCPFVVYWNGRRIATLRHSWQHVCARAGLHVTPHTLRHTRATWLMQAGVDPWEAAGHLGMTLQTLQRYAKHSSDFQKKAAEV
jgi:integrase